MEFTSKERAVLAALIEGLYAEPGFSDVTADDLSKATGLGLQSVGGVLSSLIEKRVIWMDGDYRVCSDYTTGEMNGSMIIYLSEWAYKYHPEWAESEGLEYRSPKQDDDRVDG